jgi:PAS domain S-box-containing protein
MIDRQEGNRDKQSTSRSDGKVAVGLQAALYRLSAELATAQDEGGVCQSVVDGLHDTLGYDFVAFFLVEEMSGKRVMAASVGFVDPPSPLATGEGLSEQPLLDGKLQYTPDVNQDPRYFYGMGGSEVDVPVCVGEKVIGVLVAESKKIDDFSPRDFELLTAASQQAGIAIEKARLLTKERQRGDELDALRTTLTELTAELELPVLLEAIVERAAGLLDAAGGELALYDEANQEVEIVVSLGFSQSYVGTRHKVGDGAMGLVAKTGQPLILEDYSTWEKRVAKYSADELHAIMAVPLLLGKRLIGVISVVAAEITRKFAAPDLHLLKLFAQGAAIAIENARLFDEAQREIEERARVEAELRKYQEQLEELVAERTQELRQSEERYRSLFDGVPIGLFRTTPAGEIVNANPGLVQMLGYPSREALLADSATNAYVDEEERIRLQAVLEREGIIRGAEFQLRRYDGQEIWVKDTARAVKDEGGKVLYYEGGMEDISERKQAELELSKYRVHLEELVEERTSELQASEERYRTLFDGVPVGLYRSTPKGQILDCNPALVEMLGYPDREKFLSVDIPSEYYLQLEDRTRWRSMMEAEDIIKDFPIQVRKYDGSIIWVNDVARVVRDEQGEVLYYEGSVEDITDRKQFEEEIQRQKEYFEALFVNNPVAVVTADLDGIVVSWNPMAESLFGFSRDEAVGVPLDDLVAQDDAVRSEALGYTNQVLELDRVQVTTKRTRKDGTLVDIELLALPIMVSNELMGFIAIYHDISERIKFEEEILRQKEYFEALFLNSPVAVLTADLEANVLSWNPMAEKLFGYTQEEAIGRFVDDLVADHPDLREEGKIHTEKILREDRVQATVKRTRKDGSLIDVEVLALPLIVAGEKVGFIVLYVDISELQKAQREAEAANQAKSVFLANMSHELRTPLNAILGFTQLMDRDQSLSLEQQENLKVINRSGEHLLGLINEVLEMSKIEAGQVELQERIFDLYDLLLGLEEMFSLKAEEKNLTLHLYWDDEVPRYVLMDEGKIRQVLSNLLGNAVKFTEVGGVSLRVTCTTHSKEKVQLNFAVEDSGPGIVPEELVQIFEPFVQASTGTTIQEGTGLGLSISRKYARLMDGDITVSSKLGEGSRFQFDVLVKTAGEAEIEKEKPPLRVLGLEPGQPEYRLLIAEDNEMNRQLLLKLLEPHGFGVKEAANGQEAIEIWQDWDPHLIWMDLRMPIMDGHQATRKIKSSSKGQDTVVIALTATAYEEERERVQLEGCDDFIRKPFREDEIYAMLVKHLGVQFIYEKEESAPGSLEIPAAQQDYKLSGALAEVPISILVDLRAAIIEADLNRILELIDQVALQNPVLAGQLAELARNFEYKRLLMVIDLAGEEG